MSNQDYTDLFDTGVFGEITIKVNYDYSPKEEACGDPDGCPQEGSEETASICSIICAEWNNTDLDKDFTGDERDWLEERILAANHSTEDCIH